MRSPVRMLTTPPGTSEVARTSVSVTAGSGRVSEASTTTVFPATSGGARRDTSPSSDDVSGATMPDDPVGSGIVKLKYGAATGFDGAEHLGDLVGPAGVPDPAVDGPVDDLRRPRRRGAPSAAATSLDELVAPALHELGDAVQDLAAVHRGAAGPRLERGRGPPGPHPGRPCARPGRRWRAAIRRRPSRRTSARSRSAGTRRRCTACRSCGRRSARPRGPPSRRGATRGHLAVLQAHVGVQPVHAALAPEPGFLVAAERATSGRTG